MVKDIPEGTTFSKSLRFFNCEFSLGVACLAKDFDGQLFQDNGTDLNFLPVDIPFEVFPLDDDVPDDEESRQIFRKFLDLGGEPLDVLFDLVSGDLGPDLIEPLPEGVDFSQSLLALPGGREGSLNFVAHNLKDKWFLAICKG